MNWIFYGLIFITVGVVKMVRDAKRNNPHVHRCPKCGTEWMHQVPDEREWPSTAAFAAAHACPECGTEQMAIDRFVDGKDLRADLQTRMRCRPVARPPQSSMPSPGRSAPGASPATRSPDGGAAAPTTAAPSTRAAETPPEAPATERKPS